MPATADELRLELIARIARPRLLALAEHYLPVIEHAEARGISYWRQAYLIEVDAALDEALDAADVAILAHA